MKSILSTASVLAMLVGSFGVVPASAQSAAQSAPAKVSKTGKPVPQQGQNPADLKVTKEIQESVAADKSLSADANKVKIVTAKGIVTITGSVRTITERQALESIALKLAGAGKVIDNVKIKAKKVEG